MLSKLVKFYFDIKSLSNYICSLLNVRDFFAKKAQKPSFLVFKTENKKEITYFFKSQLIYRMIVDKGAS